MVIMMMVMMMMMMMVVVVVMIMMMMKYDTNLAMPPDANTLHAATQEQTQIVIAIVRAGHSSIILLPVV